MIFLVACTRLHPALSVGWLVSRSHFILYGFYFWTSLLLPKWSGNLKNSPCPPARDFVSRVSGLVFYFQVDLCKERCAKESTVHPILSTKLGATAANRRRSTSESNATARRTGATTAGESSRKAENLQ